MSYAQTLKGTILEAAIEGKLSVAESKDTSVEEMVDVIFAQRDKYAQMGKVSKYKELKDIDTKEIPFSIPETWTWIRLNNIYNFIDYRGMTPHKLDCGVLLITASNVKMGYLDFTESNYISPEDYEQRKTRGITQKGDILFTTEAPLGHVSICNIDVCSCGQRIITFQKYGETPVVNELYCYFFQTPYFQQAIREKQSGTTAKGIKSDRLKQLLVPLPPIEEQQRIVDRVNELLAKVDEFEKIENRLTAAKEKFPSDLRAAILQAAMQGELTEQLDTDSSVDDLLEEIRTHRDCLIADGAYKPNKKLKQLSDEDVPFDIPDSWRWIRLGYCSTYGQTKLKASEEECKSDIWSLDLEDIEKTTGRITRKCRAKDRQIGGDKVRFFKGNILYSKLRPYLLKILIADKDGICSPELIPFDMIGSINPEYIVWVLRSPHVDYIINSVTYGVKMPRVGTETMINLLIPLPPIEEQQRIVERLNALLPLCDDLVKE